ncbi:MAG: hypothetical protein IJ515_06955 [Clostridia bacterium]|nr:hypothetical protein [Clostridia bacterium]
MEEYKWRFGVVGNIVSEHTDESGNVYYGTKAFTPNTKVYINGKNWSPERGDIEVIGRNRFGHVVLESVPFDLIENIRAQRIYTPRVLSIIDYLCNYDGCDWWGRTAYDRKDTERFVKTVGQS